MKRFMGLKISMVMGCIAATVSQYISQNNNNIKLMFILFLLCLYAFLIWNIKYLSYLKLEIDENYV